MKNNHTWLMQQCVLPICLAFQVSWGNMLSLAVKNLESQGLEASEAIVISEQLRAELAKYSKIQLIERGQMDEILKEQGFQQCGCTSDACAVEFGQLLGVSNIALGAVGIAGSYTVLTVRILDVASGAVVVNKSLKFLRGVDEILEHGLNQISKELYYGLFPEELPVDTVSKAPA